MPLEPEDYPEMLEALEVLEALDSKDLLDSDSKDYQAKMVCPVLLVPLVKTVLTEPQVRMA